MNNPHKKHSNAWHREEDMNALARLYIRGFITEAEKEKAEKRMQKRHQFEEAAK